MTFDRNDVIVVPFPFTDKKVVKRRPVVVLSNGEFHYSAGHVIVAMITSAKNSSWLSDLAISNIKTAGLTVPCVIRMKLFTLPRDVIVKKIGKLTPADAKRLKENIQIVM